MKNYYFLSIFTFLELYECIRIESVHDGSVQKLETIIQYSFINFSCISLYKSTEEIKNDYYSVVYKSEIPMFLQKHNKNCHGIIVLAQDVNELEVTISEFRNYFSDRLLCYLLHGSAHLEDYLKKSHKLFGEAEVIVANPNEAYIMTLEDREFQPISIVDSTPPWGKQKIIKNFMGREFRLGAFNMAMFADYGKIDENGRPQFIGGLELKIFTILAEKMNISWYIVEPEPNLPNWGFKLPNGSWTSGVFKLLHTNQADIAIGCIFLGLERYESFYMSAHQNDVRLRHLIRRPQLLNANWSSLFRPFPWDVWILLWIAVIINSVSMSLIAKLKSVFDNFFIYKEYSSFWKSKFLSVGILMMAGIPSSSKEQGPLRFLINSWVITCFLLSTCFGSSLISHLTTPDLQHHPETIEELVKEGYSWGVSFQPNSSLFLNPYNPWHQAWRERYIPITSQEQHLELFESKKFVLWGKVIDGFGFILNEFYLPRDKLEEWEISKEVIETYYRTFPIRPGCPLIMAIDRPVTQMMEAGLIDKLVREEFIVSGERYMTEVLTKTKSKFVGASVLTIHNVQGIFYVYAIGLVLAMFSLLSELYFYKRKVNILE